MAETGLQLLEVSRRFSPDFSIRQVSFNVEPGEIVAILGASGSGKSSILHLVAGLEQPDAGEINWKGQSVLETPAHARRFGLMFQDLALFPHLNVEQNIAFGLRMDGKDAGQIAQRVEATLNLVGLAGFGAREIDGLSGGEQQRVALARAMAPKPRLIMLDEPLAALDRTLKERLTLEIPRILRATGQTALYVTHDQQEAFSLADRVVILQAGEVVQIGRPRQVYANPKSASIARFLGLVNQFHGRPSSRDGKPALRTPIGWLPLPNMVEAEVTALIRPDRAAPDDSLPHRIIGEVVANSFKGHAQSVRLRVGGQVELEFTFPASVSVPDVGSQMSVSFDPSQTVQVLPQ